MFRDRPCDWWGWWLVHPLYNLGRVWRNLTPWLG